LLFLRTFQNIDIAILIMVTGMKKKVYIVITIPLNKLRSMRRMQKVNNSAMKSKLITNRLAIDFHRLRVPMAVACYRKVLVMKW